MEKEEVASLEHEKANLKLRWLAVNADCKSAQLYYEDVAAQRGEVEDRISEIESLLAPKPVTAKKKGFLDGR